MAKRPDAEILEYILMNLRLLSFKAQKEDLSVLDSILEVAAMEVEFQFKRRYREPSRARRRHRSIAFSPRSGADAS
jgi:hypothetical protein